MGRKDIGNGFAVIDDKFILHFDSEVYRKFYGIIEFASFEIIQSNGSTFHYFRDRNHIYLESYMNAFCVLTDADVTNFHIIDFENGMASSLAMDYVFDKKLTYRLADVKELGGLYQQVGDAIYCAYFQQVESADAETFEVLHGERIGNLAKDKNHIYFRQEIVADADAASFRILEQCVSGNYYRECDHTFYALDKQRAFYIDTIARSIKPIRTKSLEQFRFEVRDGLGYALDAEYRYIHGKRSRL
ncbi:DKNYY domain-containing protein [Sphingobacterium sp. ML3W]|uniref:DKNYY domain-containing protein n=1 Tax=Sphingobacterium sp. ML3W TaxID=1538644 RepID=UPI00249BE07D|nr:DKNYY domain-containing protein [Sphingobacterium sp. ML3W]WFA79562.1 DKNYY domain-containing protein [Sphingobacterium sp. ML3W]